LQTPLTNGTPRLPVRHRPRRWRRNPGRECAAGRITREIIDYPERCPYADAHSVVDRLGLRGSGGRAVRGDSMAEGRVVGRPCLASKGCSRRAALPTTCARRRESLRSMTRQSSNKANGACFPRSTVSPLRGSVFDVGFQARNSQCSGNATRGQQRAQPKRYLPSRCRFISFPQFSKGTLKGPNRELPV